MDDDKKDDGKWSLGSGDQDSYYDIKILISSLFNIGIDVYVVEVK